MALLKKFGKTAALLGSFFVLTNFTACTEDEKGDHDEPLIYTQIETIYNSMRSQSVCETIQKNLTDYNNKNLTKIQKACKDYQNDRTSAKDKYQPLITTWPNAGYTLAAYILYQELIEKWNECSSDRNIVGNELSNLQKETTDLFTKMFHDAGCSDFDSDSDAAVRAR